MKVTGIIAEYNPFHKGHKYQIDTLRAQYQPDYVIVAMSGDFLQRGTPALLDKYTRAQMALSQGADLVFELPAWFATSSAENFAKGGILLFKSTGITDSLCFGAESKDLEKMQTLADLLITEPEWYKDALLSSLKEGLSFPAARKKALPEYSHLLDTPNNILAIEYLKALAFYDADITPISIQRKGSGYHDTDIDAPLASASAIRNSIKENLHLLWESKETSCNELTGQYPFRMHSNILPAELKEALPDTSYNIMQNYQWEASFLWADDFSLLLHHALLRENAASLLSYEDMTPALSNRLLKQRKDFLSWSDFCNKCNTKDSTYARISRILNHILLNIRKEHLAPYTNTSCKTLPYLRILGFRQSAAPLLTALKASAKTPILTSPAAAEKSLSPEGLAMLETDIFASDLYRSVLTQKCQRVYSNEFQRKLLVVKDL